MWVAIVLVLVFGGSQRPRVITDHCDILEENHYYSPDDGRHVFTQMLFWSVDRNQVERIRDWRLVKPHTDSETEIGQLHVFGNRHRGYRAMWIENGVAREVTSPLFRKTYTNFDPEIRNREIQPQELREPLFLHSPVPLPKSKIP